MGSPNFYTGSSFPSFGIEFEEDDCSHLAAELLDEVKDKLAKLSRRGLRFHEVYAQPNYHSGFQILLEPLIEVDEMLKYTYLEAPYMVEAQDYDAVRIEAVDESIYPEDLGELQDPESMRELVSISQSSSGEAKLTTNKAAFEKWMEQDALRALTILAQVAKEFGLREVVGRSWVSGVASANDSSDTINDILAKGAKYVD